MSTKPYQELIDQEVSHVSRFYGTTVEDIQSECWIALLEQGPAESLPDDQVIEIIQKTKKAHLKVANRNAQREVPLVEAFTVPDDKLSPEELEQDDLLKEFQSEKLQSILRRLPADQKKLIDTRYGFDFNTDLAPGKPMSLRKAAETLGISLKQCRTLETKAKASIKRELERS